MDRPVMKLLVVKIIDLVQNFRMHSRFIPNRSPYPVSQAISFHLQNTLITVFTKSSPFPKFCKTQKIREKLCQGKCLMHRNYPVFTLAPNTAKVEKTGKNSLTGKTSYHGGDAQNGINDKNETPVIFFETYLVALVPLNSLNIRAKQIRRRIYHV